MGDSGDLVTHVYTTPGIYHGSVTVSSGGEPYTPAPFVLEKVNFTVVVTTTNLESICKSNGGGWDEKYRECVGVSSQTCETLNGAYNECASACRHIGPVNGEQPGCIGVCVQVCSVK